jgi:hypothetical protein
MIPSGHVIIPIQAFYNVRREEINGAAKKKTKGIKKKKLLKFFSSFFLIIFDNFNSLIYKNNLKRN